MREAITKSCQELDSPSDLACPRCGLAETLTIEISCSATLSRDGTDARGDHYSDDASSCFCDDCELNSTITHVRVARGPAVKL